MRAYFIANLHSSFLRHEFVLAEVWHLTRCGLRRRALEEITDFVMALFNLQQSVGNYKTDRGCRGWVTHGNQSVCLKGSTMRYPALQTGSHPIISFNLFLHS